MLEFRPVTAADMPVVWRYLSKEPGRTCDFSYGGVLMWTDVFHYEMAICSGTLFIKGRLENDLRKVAFSLPVGRLSLADSVRLLRAYCDSRNMPLRFSAVPEYRLADFMALNPESIALLEEWSDYLYDAGRMATLSGRRMAKKRNHVNRYINLYGPDTYESLTADNLPEVITYMKALESEPASDPSEAQERRLAVKILDSMRRMKMPMYGGLLRVGGRVVAFTVGDIKHDTLFVHIEKADRDISGSYEMINHSFAADMITRYPQVAYINREDDAGDPGLRKAKMSYHPVEILKKYNVIF